MRKGKRGKKTHKDNLVKKQNKNKQMRKNIENNYAYDKKKNVGHKRKTSKLQKE